MVAQVYSIAGVLNWHDCGFPQTLVLEHYLISCRLILLLVLDRRQSVEVQYIEEISWTRSKFVDFNRYLDRLGTPYLDYQVRHYTGDMARLQWSFYLQ